MTGGVVTGGVVTGGGVVELEITSVQSDGEERSMG